MKKNGTGHQIASQVSGDLSDSSPDDEDDIDGQENYSLLSELSIDAFLDMVSDTEGDISSLLACVDLSSLKSELEGPREKADFLATSVWEHTKYRFVYHSVYHSKQFPTACYMYHCSQMHECQHKPKKGKHEGAKLRDKDAMDTFDCHGWLFITVIEGSDVVNDVKFQHKDDHIPYWNIDVPEDVQDFGLAPVASRSTTVTPLQAPCSGH